MMITTVSQEDWHLVRGAKQDSEHVVSRARQLAMAMHATFDDSVHAIETGLVFTAPAGDASVSLETPFGHARLRLEVGVIGNGVVGSYFVERAYQNERDERIWKKVYVFYVTNRSGDDRRIHSGRFGNPVDLDKSFGPDSIFAACMTMLYAIAKGPESLA